MRLPIYCLLLTVLASPQVVWADAEGWVLEQSAEMIGPQKTRLSSEGLVCAFDEVQAVAVVKPPKWNVMFINAKLKRYCELTQKQYHDRSAPDPKALERIDFQKSRTGKLAGLDVDIWTGYKSVYRPRSPKADKSGWEHTPQKRREIYVTKQIKFPKELGLFITHASYLPPEAGFPLRMIKFHVKTGKPLIALDTLSCKKVRVPTSAFAVPGGYKHVQDETEVMVADSKREKEVEDIFGGFLDDAPKKPSKTK